MTFTAVRGGCHAIYVPDNAKNSYVFYNRGRIYATRGSAIYVSGGADNTYLSVIGDYNYDCGGIEMKNSHSKMGDDIFDRIDPPDDKPNWYT